MDARHVVLDTVGIQETLARMARQIRGAHEGCVPALIGIRTGGVFLAKRLREQLVALGTPVNGFGALDISLYRDDWTRKAYRPIVGSTELGFSIDDRRLVLVDDVLYTGRTIRAALDALIDFGRPARIELAVLVDRGHRELPICPDYVGVTIPTARDERVNVYFEEKGQSDQIVVEPMTPAP